MTEEARGPGQPTAYRSAHCARVIELGKEGKSVAQMAVTLGCHKDSLYEWAKVHSEFSDAFTYARLCAQDWWETKAQENLTAPSFQSTLWSRSMAARFPDDYTERQKREVTGAEGGPIETVTKITLVAGNG